MKQHLRKLVLTVSFCIALSQLSEGQTGNNNPTGVTGDYNGSIMTAGGYDPYTGNAKRIVDDLTVTGSVGAYPLKWTRILNTRGGDGGVLGGGGTWGHSYQWALWVGEDQNGNGHDGSVGYPDGRVVDYTKMDEHQYYHVQVAEMEPADRLEYQGPGDSDYDLLLKDGGKVIFRFLSTDGHVLARSIIDPYGQTTELLYEPGYPFPATYPPRLVRVKEPGGRYLQINYYTEHFHTQHPPGDHYTTLISSVQAFASSQHLTPTETVTYHYDRQPVAQSEMVYWNLQTVDYADTSHAYYTYYPANSATSTNPGVSGRIETCRDKRYAGPMSNIFYVYANDSHVNGHAAVGQVKEERNLAGLPLSTVIYPTGTIPPGQRTETRPAGATNATRTFQYGGAELTSSTDFESPNHLTTIAYQGGGGAPYTKIVTDARLNWTTTDKEPIAGAVMAVSHNNGPARTFLYTDPNNPYYVWKSKDERQNETTYTRDPVSHAILHIAYPDGGSEDFTYNILGQVLTHKMTSGGTETFTYDTGGRGLKTHHYPPPTESNQNPVIPTQYFYYGGPSGPGEAPEAPAWPDLMDRLRRVIDARGNSTWYEYNRRGQVTRVTHPGESYTLSYYNDDGTLQWTEDELRHRTQFLYDEYKRVTSVTNHLGEVTRTGYAPEGVFDPLSHTTSSAYWVKSDLSKETRYDYDKNFRRTLMIQAPGTADAASTQYHYDAVGNLDWTKDPRQYQTDFQYDERNRLWKTIVTIGNPPEVTEIKYDPAGNKRRETRPDGVFRTWDYDEMDRLAHTYEWRTNEDPRPDQTTTYLRDHAGNVKSIKDTKQAVYEFDYDYLNRKTVARYPTTSPSPTPTETWLYDRTGNILEYKNPAGQVRHFHHDDRNRQDESWWTGAGLLGPRITTGYDEASRVTSITTRSATTNNVETILAFGYDHANRKLWEDQTVAGEATHRVNAPLDRDGRRTGLQLIDSPGQGGGVLSTSEEMSGSGSYSITFDYTERNQLKHIYGGPGEDWSFFYEYDANGNMASRRADYNGRTNITQCPTNGSDDGYDALNRPKRWEQIGPNGFHAFSHYQYDRANREIATWRDEENQKGERFTYEPTNQLATAAYNGHVANGWPTDAERTVTYAYTLDRLNRSSVTETAGGVTTVKNYTPNALNQYTALGGMSFSYDNNFNLTGVGAFLGNYNAANQLVSASYSGSTVWFVYDGLGRCVKRTVGNEAIIFVYDGWKPIGEFYAGNNFLAWNVYGPGADEILLRQKGKIGYTLFLSDRHGNVAFLVDNDGGLRESYKYDAFGRPTIISAGGEALSSSWYSHGFLFQGREYISQLGVYDYRNRFYLPATGRFLQIDPVGFGAGDMNLFRYCGDDPIDGSDPLGLLDVGIEGFGTWTFERGSTKNTVGNVALRNYINAQGGIMVNRNQSGQRQAIDAVRQALAKNPKEPIRLFGYSRGADAVNQLAGKLGKEGVSVAREVLIDPVRKLGTSLSHPVGGPQHLTIPSNVKQADNYYQNNGNPYRGGAITNPGPNYRNHDLTNTGVDHNTIVKEVVTKEITPKAQEPVTQDNTFPDFVGGTAGINHPAIGINAR